MAGFELGLSPAAEPAPSAHHSPRADRIIPLRGPWRRIQRYRELVSTQKEARHLIQQGGFPDGVVLWADRQTGGVGRYGRPWASPEGGLYLTAILPLEPPPPAERGWISLTAALAGVDILDSIAGIRPMIKWPNDLIMDRGKLGGILTEVVDRYVLVGFGLNWAGQYPPPEENEAFEPVTVARYDPELTEDDKQAFVEWWLHRFLLRYEALLSDPVRVGVSLARRIEPVLYGRGERICIEGTPHGDIEGRLLGLGPGASARIHRDDGSEVTCPSGRARFPWQA